MICNISRIKGFNTCRQREYNREILRLEPIKTPEPLMTGKSYHDGSAHFFATWDVEESSKLAEKAYRKELEGQVILDAERPGIEREIQIAKTAVEKYAEYYSKEDFIVLMPEVSFCVPIPNTFHHCWYAHKLLYPDVPYEKCPVRPSLNWPSGKPDRCWMPHYLRGRTDAVLQWRSMTWIFEQKTSGAKQKTWWRQWNLDVQLTGYTYGMWKATGVRPMGVLLNKITKPAKNESLENWLAKPSDEIFNREPFLRSNSDLARFEKQFAIQCDEYETAMRTENIWMNTDACFDWNRECYYHSICVNHGEITPGTFTTRPNDYVEDAYYEVLGVENPNKKAKDEQKQQDSDSA
jgi:hypothetical protein